MTRLALRATILALAGMALAVPGRAEVRPGDPLGMILAVEGPSEPALQPAQDLVAGRITLQRTTRVTLAHFASCQVVTLVGGVIDVMPERFDATGEVAAFRTRCPAEAARPADARAEGAGGVMMAAPPAVPSGMLLRRIPNQADQVLGLNPSVMVTGPGADRVTEVSLETDDGLVVLLELNPRQFVWPRGLRPLVPGASVIVIFQGADGPQWRIRQVFKVDARQGEPTAVLVR
ncbi:hypothetical protein [Zavarzinia sp. CC-PAN008]|uniref:hypothetical protein n=1 Tax=Zavarzinia sp. CC-PAN008 TaxID=3243332 RepID=UPI003F7444A6